MRNDILHAMKINSGCSCAYIFYTVLLLLHPRSGVNNAVSSNIKQTKTKNRNGGFCLLMIGFHKKFGQGK